MKASAYQLALSMAAVNPLPERSAPALPLFMSASALVARRAVSDFHVLGVIGFGDGTRIDTDPGFPAFSLPMQPLGGSGLVEVWTSAEPVVYGQFGRIRFAANKQILFGGLHLWEHEHDTPEQAAYHAYQSVLELIGARGYPHLLRMWNYFPGINDSFLGLERYQHFCLGRYQAFVEHSYAFDRDLPAASAIGIQGAGLWVYFLAGRMPGLQIENPRQISAYRYPRRYGPRSPSFSRATLANFAGEQQLYISGTASIVGHETRHPDDTAAQLRETITNIRTILDHPALHSRRPLERLDGSSQLKVYVRHPADFDLVSDLLIQAVGPNCPILYLQGDICRRDLLLEIEGVIGLPR